MIIYFNRRSVLKKVNALIYILIFLNSKIMQLLLCAKLSSLLTSKTNNMIIVVNHKINNPVDFWAAAQASLPELPVDGVKRIIQVMPNTDNTEATCVWEADSKEALDKYLRSKVGEWSNETYQEVNTAAAMGLSV
jgi:hypothetical protein